MRTSARARPVIIACADLPTRVVDAAHPVFRILVPTLQQALPVVEFLGLYRHEVATAISSLAASRAGSALGIAASTT